MAKSLLRKTVSSLLLALILTITLTFYFAPKAEAETTIISITPSSAEVGTPIQLNGTITTENGTYTVKFDQNVVTSGEAVGYEVNATFNVPNTYAGSHDVTLIDDGTGENYVVTLTVLTSYSLEITPVEPPKKQRQEGDVAMIYANITGGNSSKLYVANITVQNPTNATYTKLLNMTTSDKGNITMSVSFPNDFLSDNPNANTNFTGEYKVFFNTTLATKTFFVGLTNSTEYHRFDSVDIKATGYQPDENTTITVSFGGQILHSDSVNATGGGIISANWSVPSNATMGIYTLSITSKSGLTIKSPPDIQNFTVPGLDVNITTRNLAREPVPNVAVKVFENATSAANSTSDSSGLASVKLEIGNYTGEAYFRDQKVGERWLNITGATSLDFECNLTNLRILVTAIVNDVEISVPEVELFLVPENQTATTNITGMAIFHSLLPNVTYTLNASRYNVLFNVTSIPTLLVNEAAKDWFDVSIVCPMVTLQVNVTNSNANNQPISNVIVKVKELIGGISYEGNTDINGIAVFNPIFGKYKIEVYDTNKIKLNETTVELFKDENVSISCSLYGLKVTIKVVDYFGQPISNALVTLHREGQSIHPMRTQSDGTVTFDNVIGGNLEVNVYLADQTQPCVSSVFFVDKSTTIEIKIDKYVMLVGFLVETSQLITIIIIAVTIIVILSIEVYRRKRRKPQKSEN